MNNRQLLSATLKQYRRDLGLTQEQVALALQIDRSTYAYYESGRSSPSLEIAAKFANLFGITIDALVCRDADNSADSRARDENFRFLRKDEQNLLLYYRQLPSNSRDDVCKYANEHLQKVVDRAAT